MLGGHYYPMGIFTPVYPTILATKIKKKKPNNDTPYP